MHASWRLREQKRKEEAEAAERRRAVEKNEISFPSLGNVGWGEAPKTESDAAQRWSAGDVVRSTPRVSSASSSSQSGGGGGSKQQATVSSPPLGVHARIAAEVRRTQCMAKWRSGGGGSDYEGDCFDKDDEDCGWTEVSKTKTKSKKMFTTTTSAAPPVDYYDDDDYDY